MRTRNITRAGLRLLMMAVMGGLAPVANAQQLLFFDNFESDIAGTSPTTDDLDPVLGAGDTGGSWLMEEDGPQFGQVLNDLAIADSPITGNNFLRVERGWSGQANAWMTGWDHLLTSNVILRLDYSLYMPTPEFPGDGRMFVLAIGGPGQWDYPAAGINVYGDGDIKNAKNNDTPPIDIVAALDQWQQVTYFIDMPNLQYDVTVGNSTVEDVPFRDSDATDITRVAIGNAATPSHFYVDNVRLEVVSIIEPPTGFDWQADGIGLWNQNVNWSPGGGPPNSSDQTAVFSHGVDEDTLVGVNSSVTVNRIEFNNATYTYAIGGVGSVTLAESTSQEIPRIDVLAGTHQFQAEVALANNTTLDVAGGAQLTFNNVLGLNGNTLDKVGDGTVAINNVLASSGGTVNCLVGTCTGSGTISGDLNNDATVSPGNSPGVMAIEGDYTQGDNGTLLIELAGTGAGTDYDRLQVGGEVSLDGTLEISLIDGFQPAPGDTFDILDFASLTGDFDEVNLPSLGGSLAWDDSALLVHGSIAVVPEPATLLMVLGGLLGLATLSTRESFSMLL